VNAYPKLMDLCISHLTPNIGRKKAIGMRKAALFKRLLHVVKLDWMKNWGEKAIELIV
jgi:hypothetical protein